MRRHTSRRPAPEFGFPTWRTSDSDPDLGWPAVDGDLRPFIDRMRALAAERGPQVWAPFDDPSSVTDGDDGLRINGQPPAGATIAVLDPAPPGPRRAVRAA